MPPSGTEGDRVKEWPASTSGGRGGPVSRPNHWLFRGAIYLPMVAGMLAYRTPLAPVEYEGNPYFALSSGAGITAIAGLAATSWVIAYLAWTLWRNRGERVNPVSQKVGLVHPGE